MPAQPKTKKTMLGAVSKAASAQRKATTDRDHLIATAVHYGCTQVEVAEAAGMSQAHVSRISAHFRRLADERRAARSARSQNESRTA